MPTVSVIIPTYNRAGLIDQTIDSVLAQTYQDLEIIVVDDGSTDRTEELLLKKYGGKITYMRQKNKGVAAARNKGISMANGKFIALLDDDDIWYPEKLASQVPLLEKNEKIGLVGCLMDVIDENGKPLLGRIKPKKIPGDSFESGLLQGSPPPSTFLIRRKCFDEIGLFDGGVKIFEDLDIYLRISKKYLILIINMPLGSYREHSSNMTKYNSNVYPAEIIFAKKWLSLCEKKDKNARVFLIKQLKKYSLLMFKQELKKLDFFPALKYLMMFIGYCFQDSE